MDVNVYVCMRRCAGVQVCVRACMWWARTLFCQAECIVYAETFGLDLLKQPEPLVCRQLGEVFR